MFGLWKSSPKSGDFFNAVNHELHQLIFAHSLEIPTAFSKSTGARSVGIRDSSQIRANGDDSTGMVDALQNVEAIEGIETVEIMLNELLHEIVAIQRAQIVLASFQAGTLGNVSTVLWVKRRFSQIRLRI